MVILGLDQASATGYAAGDAEAFRLRTAESGVFKSPKRPILGEQLASFRDTLNELIAHYKPELIAYEKPYQPFPGPPKGSILVGKAVAIVSKGGDWRSALYAAAEKEGPPPIDIRTLQFLQKLEGMVIVAATDNGLPYEAYAPASWRGSALGYARAPFGSPHDFLKRAMFEKAKSWGFKPETFDESDAIGILSHALFGEPGQKRAQGDLLEMGQEL